MSPPPNPPPAPGGGSDQSSSNRGLTPPVVFLHGLARTHRSLSRLRREVERAGYETWARTYPSRHLPMAELTQTLADWIRDDLGDRPVFGVTHSLGGVLARHLVGRVDWAGLVMLAPPNNGSRVAAVLQANRVFRWYFGPVAEQLARPDEWPEPPTPVGIIAGTLGVSLGNPPSWGIRGLSLLPPDEPNDGTVTVAETRHPLMTAFATVPASHTWIMNHPRTRDLVLSFLEGGTFPTLEEPRPDEGR